MLSAFSICTNSPIKWHSRGQRFDPAYLHQKTSFLWERGFLLLNFLPIEKPPGLMVGGFVLGYDAFLPC